MNNNDQEFIAFLAVLAVAIPALMKYWEWGSILFSHIHVAWLP